MRTKGADSPVPTSAPSLLESLVANDPPASYLSSSKLVIRFSYANQSEIYWWRR